MLIIVIIISSSFSCSHSDQVRNRSLVNRNVIGDTGIHAVTTEIERLKSRLEERSSEFDRLRQVGWVAGGCYC